jgi:putative ABC transport system ATP-binding protein
MKKPLIGATTSKYAIDLKNVVKYYSNGAIALKVLKGIDLQINYGEFVVILGPSGSGKTTLLNIISGMDKATYGRTMIAGVDLINKNSSQLTKFRKEKLGYIFQQYGLLPNLTVRENVEIGGNLQKDKSKRMDIDELLRTIGIFEHSSNFPHQLSGGQQQRVSIARSMAKNPTLIFGDEPTGAIDEEMSKHIMQLFVDINKKFKTTVIIVTHNPILAGLATTVIKVNNGKIADVIKNHNPKQVNELE